MNNQLAKPNVPPWLHKLFTGHQYPYVRRLAKFAQPIKPGEDRQEPTKEMIEAKFWEVYPRCWAKILQEVKVGMIVVFHDLGEYPAGGYQELVDDPDAFLAKTYGKKKPPQDQMVIIAEERATLVSAIRAASSAGLRE